MFLKNLLIRLDLNKTLLYVIKRVLYLPSYPFQINGCLIKSVKPRKYLVQTMPHTQVFIILKILLVQFI